jgi:hypothetical protein
MPPPLTGIHGIEFVFGMFRLPLTDDGVTSGRAMSLASLRFALIGFTHGNDWGVQ